MIRKPVLVTGGAGYVGSHTCKALAQAGYCPVTLDNLSRGNRSAVRWGPFEEADLRDATAVARIFDELQTQYMLAFEPTHADGKYHEISVTTRNRDLRVRARTGYTASESRK